MSIVKLETPVDVRVSCACGSPVDFEVDTNSLGEIIVDLQEHSCIQEKE
jgi:hypothetical protein